MSKAPDSIYDALNSADDLEKACKESIVELVDTLTRIKEVEADLTDCKNFARGPDEDLKYVCENLLRSLEIMKEDINHLQEMAADMFSVLGFTPEWDDKREEWHLKGEHKEEEFE